MTGQTIQQWSHSRLVTYESCAYRAFLQYIKREPEPPLVPPRGKDEHPLERGNRLHELGELFITSEEDLEVPSEYADFKQELVEFRDLYRRGTVQVEGDWGFDINWEKTAWTSSTVWARMKLDVFTRVSETHAIVSDWKSGKKFGNEIKHGEQGQIYMVGAAARYPELEEITVEFLYIDQNERSRAHYKKPQFDFYRRKFDQRVLKMMQDTEFKPKPNKFVCKWCPYRPEEDGGTGVCAFAWQLKSKAMKHA